MNAHSNIDAATSAALSGDAMEFAGIEDSDATSGRRARRDERRKKAVRGARAASKPYPALAAAVEAWAVTRAEEDAFYSPHDDAQQAEFALKHRTFTGGPNAPSGAEVRKAKLLTERTEDRWSRAVDRTIRAVTAILSVEPTDFAMAEAKQVAFTKAGGPDVVEDAEALMNRALRLDLRMLTKLPEPTPPAGEGDRALLSAAASHKSASDRLDACEFATSEDRAHAKQLGEVQAQSIAAIMAKPAITMAGLRAKALAAAWYQPFEGVEEFDQVGWKVQIDLVKDVLALTGGALPIEASQANWIDALGAYEAAKTAAATYSTQSREVPSQFDEATDVRLWNAVCASLFKLEQTPAPDIHALAYVMREAIEMHGLDWRFHDIDCADTMSDLLSGDVDKAMIATTYMQVLRLAGIDSPALAATPYATFDRMDAIDRTPGQIEAAWREHHRRRREGLPPAQGNAGLALVA